MMMRWISLISVVIVGVGAAAFVYQTLPEPSPVPEPTLDPHHATPEGPPPKLEIVGKKTHEFGTMGLGKKGAHTWEFKNVGQGPLDVWLEETTCSCTVATLKSGEAERGKRVTIAAGQSAPITVDWDTRRPGRFAQSAMLGTTDPDNHDVTLSILGMVVPSVEARPSETVTFPDSSTEEALRTTLDVVSLARPGLKLTKVATSRPGLVAAEARPMSPEELEKLKVKSGYHLDVRVKPGMPSGRFTEEVLIDTDDPGRPSLKIALTGHVIGPIAVIPERLLMPSVPGIAGASRDIALVVRGNRETKLEVASKSEKLRVAISRSDKPEAKGRYRMTVTVPPGTPPGLIDQPIVLKTDYPQVGEVRVPVSIYVSSRSDAG